MGALPGGRLLIGAAPPPFDVEHFRTATRPVAVVRSPVRPVLVLGSTQSPDVVDADRAVWSGVAVARRRGGGGAVLVVPGSTVWVDLWIPAGDTLSDREPRATAARVGTWWCEALRAAGAEGIEVASGGAAAGGAAGYGRLACFAALGPGEVHRRGCKVVGLTQWRARQGALVQGCTYRSFDPDALADLLALGEPRRRELAARLARAACGYADAGVADFGPGHLLAGLPDADRWDVLQTS